MARRPQLFAALHVAGITDAAPEIRRARHFLAANGGVEAVNPGVARGDLSALNLALAGLLDPRRLPRLPRTHILVAPARELLDRRFSGAVLTIFLQTAILVHRLRGDWAPDGLDEQACLALLDEFSGKRSRPTSTPF